MKKIKLVLPFCFATFAFCAQPAFATDEYLLVDSVFGLSDFRGLFIMSLNTNEASEAGGQFDGFIQNSATGLDKPININVEINDDFDVDRDSISIPVLSDTSADEFELNLSLSRSWEFGPVQRYLVQTEMIGPNPDIRQGGSTVFISNDPLPLITIPAALAGTAMLICAADRVVLTYVNECQRPEFKVEFNGFLRCEGRCLE